MQFNKPVDIHTVTLNCLRNLGSQIFLPVGIEVWDGKDAAHLRLLSMVKPVAPKKDGPILVKGMDCQLATNRAISCLKIIAKPTQTLPQM